MTFIQIYTLGLIAVVLLFTLLWAYSVILKNASIVDIFWGFAFSALTLFYFYLSPNPSVRSTIVLLLAMIWGLRLTAHIFYRNVGKPEDYRYQEFRKHYGKKRYWWFSFFQVFLLQGILVWLISAPLLAVNYYSEPRDLIFIDYAGIFIWITGFVFEAGGDWQLLRFKKNPDNKGKLLQTGFWKYTRHPNYFGDATVWWGFAIIGLSTGFYFGILSALLMTWLLVKVSGVSMLERTLKKTKPEFADYVGRTSAFFPWFPKTSVK